MRRSGLAEWVLKRAAGEQRGTAMYGDLVELRVTRGAAWFWMAYARTLLLFLWRMPAAFLAAMASVWTMSQLYPLWVQYQLHDLTAGWRVDMFFGRVAVVSSPFLLAIAMCLWFVLPFAWLAYGRKDPLTRLSCLLYVFVLPVFSYRVWLMDMSCVCTLALLLSSVFSSQWRRPFAVLVVTCVATVAAVTMALRVLAQNAGHAFSTYRPGGAVRSAITTCALCVAAVVCWSLHRLLLDGRSFEA